MGSEVHGKIKRVYLTDKGKKRRFLFDEISAIAEEVKVYSITSSEINEAMQNRISINELEAAKFASLLDLMDVIPKRIYLDSPDVVSERFGLRVKMFAKRPLLINGVKEKRGRLDEGVSAIRVLAEHKADARYPVVSAASIIAKVVRDDEIEKIGEREGIDVGSGYPSDKYTIAMLRANLKNESFMPYIRNRWKTINLIKQSKMADFMRER